MKHRITAMIISILTISGLLIKPIMTFAAISEYKVDEKEYNLRVEDFPTFTADWDSIYAKMNNRKDTSGYLLSLFDDYDSTDVTLAAFEAQGISVDADACYGVEITLYKQEADEEYYPVDGAVNVELICPLPDVYLDTPRNVQMYQLESGRNKPIKFSLVTVNEVICVKFKVNANAIYSFVLTDDIVESEEIPAPSKAPTVTPKPTTSVTPEPTQGVTPTKNPENTGSSGNTNSNTNQGNRPKDKTPQTGDQTSMVRWLTLSTISGIGMIWAFYEWKKK